MGRNVWFQGEKLWSWGLAAVAVVCCLGTTVVFAPGYMSPDSLEQLRQATGKAPLTDWHPPVLSLVWRALIAVTGTPSSMAVLQSVVLWGALWVVAWCVWDLTASRAGSLAVLGIGLTPPVLTFVGVVWKDVHAAAALLAACAVAFVGLRLRGRDVAPAMRWGLFGLGVLFLAYAMLVRKNVFLAAIPLFVLLVLALWRAPGRRTWALCVAALVAALVVPAVAISRIAHPVETRQGAQIMLDDLVHVLTVEELRSADVPPDLRNRLVAAAEKCHSVGALSDAYWACYERRPDGMARDADGITSLWLSEMGSHAPGYLQYRLRLFAGLLFETGYPYQAGVFPNDLGIEVAHPRLKAGLGAYIGGMGADLRPLFRGWFWLAVALFLTVRPGRGAVLPAHPGAGCQRDGLRTRVPAHHAGDELPLRLLVGARLHTRSSAALAGPPPHRLRPGRLGRRTHRLRRDRGRRRDGASPGGPRGAAPAAVTSPCGVHALRRTEWKERDADSI